MNEYTINVNCTDKRKALDELYNILNHFDKKFCEHYEIITETQRKVFIDLNTMLEEKRAEYNKEKNNLYRFFNDKLEKYWKLKIVQRNYKYEYIEEFYIFPYKLIEENGALFCLASDKINDDYNAGIHDKSFNIEDFLRQNTTITLTGITEDEFVEYAKDKIKKVLGIRQYKIETRKHQ